jgi:hypothetical protein
VAVCVFIAVGAIYFARRNVSRGRGDSKGALRVSAAITLAAMAAWALHAHHVADASEELGLFFNGLAASLLAGFVTWLLYIALEPFVRHHKPQLLISWSRLLSGNFRDPLVGRDVLAGGFGGALISLAAVASNAIPYWFDFPGETPISVPSSALGAPREVIAGLISLLLSAVVSALIVLTVLFLIRVLVRNERLSIALTTVVILLTNLGSENWKLEVPTALVTTAVVVFVLVRFGILALLAAQFSANLILSAPFSLGLSHWYAGRGIFVILLLVGAWAWGFRLALGKQPAFTLAVDDGG